MTLTLADVSDICAGVAGGDVSQTNRITELLEVLEDQGEKDVIAAVVAALNQVKWVLEKFEIETEWLLDARDRFLMDDCVMYKQ